MSSLQPEIFAGHEGQYILHFVAMSVVHTTLFSLSTVLSITYLFFLLPCLLKESRGLFVTVEHLVPSKLGVICGCAVPLHGKQRLRAQES